MMSSLDASRFAQTNFASKILENTSGNQKILLYVTNVHNVFGAFSADTVDLFEQMLEKGFADPLKKYPNYNKYIVILFNEKYYQHQIQ